MKCFCQQKLWKPITVRSSHQRCSRIKVVLRNFARFTGKHLCQSLFFNKVAGRRPQACNFIKKETLVQVFPSEFCEISKNTFFTDHPWATASVQLNSESLRQTSIVQTLPVKQLLLILIPEAKCMWITRTIISGDGYDGNICKNSLQKVWSGWRW